MHGLVFLSVTSFCRDMYGSEVLGRVLQNSGVDQAQFEPMLSYEKAGLFRLMDGLSAELGKSHEDIAEDIGTYLVAHENCRAIRRLLRFAGHDFRDFIDGLDELPDRACLALPDLKLPEIDIAQTARQSFDISFGQCLPWFCHVMIGVIRAMADDYGTLVFIGEVIASNDRQSIELVVIEQDFTQGKEFALGLQNGVI
jgi:hypothetical protein